MKTTVKIQNRHLPNKGQKNYCLSWLPQWKIVQFYCNYYLHTHRIILTNFIFHTRANCTLCHTVSMNKSSLPTVASSSLPPSTYITGDQKSDICTTKRESDWNNNSFWCKINPDINYVAVHIFTTYWSQVPAFLMYLSSNIMKVWKIMFVPLLVLTEKNGQL